MGWSSSLEHPQHHFLAPPVCHHAQPLRTRCTLSHWYDCWQRSAALGPCGDGDKDENEDKDKDRNKDKDRDRDKDMADHARWPHGLCAVPSGCTPVLSVGSCPSPPTRCFCPLPPVPCPAPGSLRSPPAGPAQFPLNLAAGLSGTARPLPQRRAGCFPAGLWGLLALPRGRGRILPTLQTPAQRRAGVRGRSPLPPSPAAL